MRNGRQADERNGGGGVSRPAEGSQDVSDRVPASAAWLGGAGLLPFFGLAAAHWAVESGLLPMPLTFRTGPALASYAALILSFMGGCRWGFESIRAAPEPTAKKLVVSVVPALYAWVALLFDVPMACAALALGFSLLLAADLALAQEGGAPRWWPRLRWPLTLGAVLSLLLGAMA
ncbi:hypothetical protein LNKW23_33130 [Paralimibaculum aggregatum]|uniref:DUF3429 domain-containing protein n=1 Tax=Paralimibaculum aggregatum TaxID=3036245 RepID=A0ABQ6LP27_9RHOB|nr:DUF3429 domain-containing protein [Limibaculum sp. NKW23]GMG84099.1 hypothetical protein LNKW23_33130 [Limibaculum sp. NKW23]